MPKSYNEKKYPSLTNYVNAVIEPSKFINYSMDPMNPGNQGKWKAFQMIGFDVSNINSRRKSAKNIIDQIRDNLSTVPAKPGKLSRYGQRFEVRISITGPNGRDGTLLTIWQIDRDKENPRLITNWLEVHK